MNKKGLFIVISGPSGVGKSTVIEELLKAAPNLYKSVSVTTRKPRPGEKEGVHYFFRSQTEYQQMIADSAFLETAEVYTNFYGTPKKTVLDYLDKGEDVIGELDTWGARQVKKSYPESVRIYLMPPDFAELERRLKERNTEDEASLQRRIASAKKELSEYKNYSYIVFNDSVKQAVCDIMSIIAAEKCTIERNAAIIEEKLL